MARFAFEFGKLKHMPALAPKIKRKSSEFGLLKFGFLLVREIFLVLDSHRVGVAVGAVASRLETHHVDFELTIQIDKHYRLCSLCLIPLVPVFFTMTQKVLRELTPGGAPILDRILRAHNPRAL